MKYKINKTTCEVYKIRFENDFCWANITIDDLGKQGRIQIASDYGDWQYFWGACGVPFKKFLCKLGIDYVASKFGEGRSFDHKETINDYKREVIEYRRSEGITAELARDIWEEIKALEDEIHLDGFNWNLSQSDHLMQWYDHCPPIQYRTSPSFKRFWDEVWGVFVNELKVEIKELREQELSL